jgi:hypothetical protein
MTHLAAHFIGTSIAVSRSRSGNRIGEVEPGAEVVQLALDLLAPVPGRMKVEREVFTRLGGLDRFSRCGLVGVSRRGRIDSRHGDLFLRVLDHCDFGQGLS